MNASSPPARAWIRLPSGKHLDLINPDPLAWDDKDLVLRISRTYRWGGESKWSQPLSVAQHSLTVLALRRLWSPVPLNVPEARLELLHDAEEAFLGVDMISPVKAVLGAPFQTLSERLMSAIATRYALPNWSELAYLEHKRADTVAAAAEAVHCVGWTVDEVRDVLGIAQPVLFDDPLVPMYDCEPWEPWPADVAAERFMLELDALRR